MTMNRPGFAAMALGVVAPLVFAAETPEVPHSLWAYIGTYTAGASEGIYRLSFDAQTGQLGQPELAAKAGNPSFLALHPTKPLLYAVGEAGESLDGVTGFLVDPETGDLTRLNRAASMGRGPCHITVAPGGRNVAVANYSGGSIATLPLREDGALGDASAFVQHTGSSVNPQRQREAHAHSVNFDPSGRFLFAADLGTDHVMIYRFDERHGTLEANDPPSVQLAPGAGPRHFALHPSGKFAYVINELDNTITAFACDLAAGRLDALQSISTVPEEFTGESYTAEIRVHPSGRFVYGSNRGHDSIALFAVDPASGALTSAGWTPTQGKTPRHFNIEPGGKFLIAANQDSDSLAVFRIDPASGALEATGQLVSVPTPVCVVFRPIVAK
ncbi:MAG: lactonase family protein [Candidatus Hydrogenedentales bacterium]|jgi:6-phosphogluconolactonase